MDTRISLQPGFVLHRRQYGDSSLIVDVLTRDYGRVSVVAKGIRSGKNRGQRLQAFTELYFSWLGRGELKTLTDVESSTLFDPLLGVRLYAALYVNELLVRLLPKFDSHPRIFIEYRELLLGLPLSEDMEPRLRSFEFRLLAELGYAIDLERDAKSNANILASQSYRYFPERGFFPSAGDHGEDREVFHGEDLLAIGAGNFSDPHARRAAKRLIRLALSPHLGSKPLKSRELFTPNR